jgi:hypothetical protein
MWFRHLRPEETRRELQGIIEIVLQKTVDVKVKVRDASTNFCLYLAHQNNVGVNIVTDLVMKELKPALKTGKQDVQ